MLEHIFWWAGTLLEGVILWRGMATDLFRRYSFFYLYLAYVMLQSLVHLLVFDARAEWYAHIYWSTQILGAIFGYILVWGIATQTLSSYSGAARMARSLLTGVFAFLITRAIVVAWSSQIALPAAAAEIERDVRAVQAILFLVLLLIYNYYRVPLNVNLKGMFLGYGLYIAVSVMVLASRTLLVESHGLIWRYLQPSAYAAALGIWCRYLWSPAAAISQSAAKAPLEVDYEALAANTARLFVRLRIYLARAVRP